MSCEVNNSPSCNSIRLDKNSSKNKFKIHCDITCLVQQNTRVWKQWLKLNLDGETTDPNSLPHNLAVRFDRHVADQISSTARSSRSRIHLRHSACFQKLLPKSQSAETLKYSTSSPGMKATPAENNLIVLKTIRYCACGANKVRPHLNP